MTEGIEPQEEMNEILEPVLDGQPVEIVEEAIEEQEVDGLEVEEPTIDTASPAYLAGQEAMKEQMQNAVDRRIAKSIRKGKAEVQAARDEFNSKFLAMEKAKLDALPEPTIDDFINTPNPEVELIKAVQKRALAQQQVQPVAAPVATQISESAQDYIELEADYVKSNPTYINDVTNMLQHVNASLQEALYDTDPATVHKLAGDLDKVQELAKLTPSQMGRAISNFELESKRGQSTPKRAIAKPAPTATKRGESTSGTKDISAMSQNEYNRFMANL